jgi:hypothetical protein
MVPYPFHAFDNAHSVRRPQQVRLNRDKLTGIRWLGLRRRQRGADGLAARLGQEPVDVDHRAFVKARTGPGSCSKCCRLCTCHYPSTTWVRL